MIGVKLNGRLGNQLFQYALAVSNSKKKRIFFFIDQSDSEFLLNHFFVLNRFNKYLNKLYGYIFFNYCHKIKYYIEWTNYDIFNSDSFNNNCIFEGYFQSEIYFESIRSLILSEYCIKQTWIDIFKKKYYELFINNKVIAVHVRKTDYTNWDLFNSKPGDFSLPDEYYKKLIHQLQVYEDYLTIFISDDILYCKEHFNDTKNSFFEENESIIDLQILINADICILSNSSFSWWGAYLNGKKHKQIYAPKYWVGYKDKIEYPIGIMNVNWHWVDV